MRQTIFTCLLLIVTLGLQAQDDFACWAKVYPSKVKGIVVLEYRVGFNEGNVKLIGELPGKIGIIGTSSLTKGKQELMSYRYCYTIPDSTHFWVPSANLMNNGSIICAMQGFWVATDTLDWDYMKDMDEPGAFTCEPTDFTKLYTKPDFKWIAGIKPEITITAKSKVALYDTVHVTVSSNFPLDELVDKIPIVNLERYGNGGSQSKFTNKDGAVSSWFFSETIILYAGTKGTALVEPFDFQYLGKIIKVPGVKIKVK